MPPATRRPRNSASSSMRAARRQSRPAPCRRRRADAWRAPAGATGSAARRAPPPPSSRAKTPSGETVERRAGRIVDVEAPAAEFDGDAPGDRRGRASPAPRSRLASPPPRGARARWPSASSCSLRATSRRRRQALGAAARRAVRSAAQRVGGLGRAQRLGDEPARAPASASRGAAPSGIDVVAQRCRASAEELLQAELRMADGGGAAPSASPIACPGGVVEVLIEAGQHDRAVAAGRAIAFEQLGGGGDRAGRAGGDDRPGRAARRRSPRRGSAVAAHGRIDPAALGEMRRPVLGDDLQEIERDLEVARRGPPARGCRAASHGMPAVSMSSISRARSPASRAASAAEAGIEQRLVRREAEQRRGGRRGPRRASAASARAGGRARVIAAGSDEPLGRRSRPMAPSR